MDSGTTEALIGVWGSSSSNVFAVGGDSIIHYDGSSWSEMESGITASLYAVWGSSSSDVFAVGSGGTILYYDGSTWNEMDSGTNKGLWNIWGSSSSDVFAGGGDGTIMHYPAIPTITSLNPDQGTQGTTLDVTITGTNLTGASTASLGSGITVNSFIIDSATQITANITIDADAATGTRDVAVTTPGRTATLLVGFIVEQAPPTITSINPDQSTQGTTLNVIITGTFFNGASAVSFGTGITVNSYTVDSVTQITADITINTDAETGTRYVSVTTVAGIATWPDGFAVVVPPSIARVDPAQAGLGETLNVIITGTNFTGASAVSFDTGITVNSYTVDSATQIMADITIDADAETGTRDVSATTVAGTATLSDGFNVEQAVPVGGGGCGRSAVAAKLDMSWGIIGIALPVGFYWSRKRRSHKK